MHGHHEDSETMKETGGFITQCKSIRPSGQRRVTKPVHCVQERTEEEANWEKFSEQLIGAVLSNRAANSLS